MKTHEMVTLSTGHGFLEAPRWHDGVLWLSDFFRKRVVRIAEDGSVEVAVAHIENAPSGLGFLEDGSVLVTSQYDRRVLRVQPDGSQAEHADLSSLAGGNANDMLVTPSGHAYVGNFGYDTRAEEPRPTTLAHVRPDGSAQAVPGSLHFPNGMGILPDRATLVVSETGAHRISAYDIQPDHSLTRHRVWVDLPDGMRPDGLAVDSDGGVWFANANTTGPKSGFYRVEESGEITDVIPTPGTWAIACSFGGPASDVLHLVCNDTTWERFRAGDSDGSVSTARVGRRGV